jgi:hypothetical protein
MLTRELLQSYGWPNDETTELALAAAEALLATGLGRDAVLVWLDQVCAQPGRYLSDPVLAPLARASLRQALRALQASGCTRETIGSAALACRN